jgi:mono/diheme cytochrome c family protein
MTARLISSISLCIVLAASVSGPALADASDTGAGHRLALSRCGGCHAVAKEGDSPLAAAPPFRTLARNYPLENLEEALAEGIFAGHPDMPDDPWAPLDIQKLITYLKTVQTP